MSCAALTVETGAVDNQATNTNVGMAVGFSLAAVFVIAMVITFVVITVVLRRRNRRGKYILRPDKIQGNVLCDLRIRFIIRCKPFTSQLLFS